MVVETKSIPDGIPKSGRVWKTKQVQRASAQVRSGILKNQCKSYEERKQIKEQRLKVLELEKELKGETKRKIEEKKLYQQEKRKRLMEAEYKNSSYQVINPEKLKTMSKKQLRLVKKTSMNKNGQVELVNPWGGSITNTSTTKKLRK